MAWKQIASAVTAAVEDIGVAMDRAFPEVKIEDYNETKSKSKTSSKSVVASSTQPAQNGPRKNKNDKKR